MPRLLPLSCALTLGLTLSACGGDSPQAPRSTDPKADAGAVIQDGPARFTVLTPSLIRLEYADDGHFEERATQTVINRRLPVAQFSTAIEAGERVIRTEALTLRYRRAAGAFASDNLSLEMRIAGHSISVKPDWNATDPRNLGGWRRGLDNEQDPQPLHPGLLSRAGWFLLDDTATVLLTDATPGFVVRPAHNGAYQDGYLFGYGHDYAQGLSDLRAITGAAPLLPRKALGVWFSRYWAYSESELHELVAQFRAHAVPLDTLSIDTDWKRMHNAVGCVVFSVIAGARTGDPCSWNGWDWNRELFPDPAAFLAWAHQQGLEIGLNIHPSLSSRDPQYAVTQAAAGPLATDSALPPCTLYQADPLAQCHVFDWTDPRQLAAYFALHAPLGLGVDFWWLDWCCDGSSATAPGLTADTWINAQYQQDNLRRGSRWPAFSRIGASFQEGKAGIANKGAGAFAEHRHTLHFTGDTCGTWQMLAYEAEFTAAEGNIGMPYVSHDIGSFLGPPKPTTGCNGTLGHTSHLPDDLYVRWLQFGSFQPLQRLHSNHGDRLPWEYPGTAEAAATEFLRLRGRLVPYLYTLSRVAHDSGLPMARALYLQWPELDEAYNHRTQYTLGNDVLVAPVTVAGDPAVTSVWLPPGHWTDYFTGETFNGPATLVRSVPLDRYPVFLRAGAILPTQPDLPTSAAGPQDGLTLSVWPGAEGHFDLYEDEGSGFGYQQKAYRWTSLSTSTSAQGCVTLNIGAAQGRFPGALTQRSWTVRFIGVDAPAVVRLNNQSLSPGSWSYDAARRSLSMDIPARSAGSQTVALIGPAGC